MKLRQILAFGAAVAITTGGVVTLASPANAAPQVVVQAPSDIPTRLVRYSDLNLTAAHGKKMLNRRVAVAVNEVCEGSESYANFQTDGFCRTAAWDRARPQIERAIERAHTLALNGQLETGEQAISIAL